MGTYYISISNRAAESTQSRPSKIFVEKAASQLSEKQEVFKLDLRCLTAREVSLRKDSFLCCVATERILTNRNQGAQFFAHGRNEGATLV